MKKPRAAKNPVPNETLPSLAALRARFERHPERHPGVAWATVQARLEACAAPKLRALAEMERTGGEPDVIGVDETGACLFVDCSEQSPAGRLALSYDREGLDSRKEHKPAGSAVEAAEAMGAELLDEALYQRLQAAGEFDTKSSSWLRTPPDFRAQGGALFGERRRGRVFIYHNGAQSYYGARGFRAVVRV